MQMEIPDRGTPWQKRIGQAIKRVFGAAIVAVSVASLGWEVFHSHNHTGHQVVFSGLAMVGFWIMFEEAFLRALETLANIIHVLLPWGGKRGSDD